MPHQQGRLQPALVSIRCATYSFTSSLVRVGKAVRVGSGLAVAVGVLVGRLIVGVILGRLVFVELPTDFKIDAVLTKIPSLVASEESDDELQLATRNNIKRTRDLCAFFFLGSCLHYCISRITLEFTCAGFAPDATIINNFAAQPRLIKSHD